MPNVTDDRVLAMLLGRRKVRPMPFPGQEDVKFGIRILLDEEVDHCRIDAISRVIEFAKRRQLNAGEMLMIEPELLDREIQRQLIGRACVDLDYPEGEEPRPFFPDPNDIRRLDTVMVQTLYECYMEHQNYVNPLKELDEEEVRGLAEALGKGPTAEVILSQYDAPTLRKLLHITAAQLGSAPIGKLAIGGSPETEIPS